MHVIVGLVAYVALGSLTTLLLTRRRLFRTDEDPPPD
jgi:hypothetical protein